jgi:cyclomaltodextrinase
MYIMKYNKINSLLPVILASLVVCIITASCQTSSSTLPLNQKQARKSPDWVTNGIIYQIQPRAFTQEGTLKAATARLQKVAELGINIVYLCPVFLADDDTDTTYWSPRQKASGMNNPRNPYRMKDYYQVDPEYGTNNDLKDFVAEAHKLGMRVMLDMVYMHCGPKAVFIKDHPDFVKRDKEGKVINSSYNFPEMNLENPELREYLWKNMEYWVKEFSVDGFRCDVADKIPLDFWETARDRLEKICQDVGMLAEGTRGENLFKAFDLNYSGALYSSFNRIFEKGEPVSILQKACEEQAAKLPKGSKLIRYTENHDLANNAWANRSEKRWGAKAVNNTLVIIFTLDGVPFLYNGQEVSDEARHSIWGRLPVNWANGDTPDGKARFAFIQKLIEMRKSEPSLTEGKLEWIENSLPDEVLSFTRTLGKEQILIVVNLTGKQVNVNLEGSDIGKSNQVKPLLVNGIMKDDNPNTFEFQDYGYWVGKLKTGK